MSKLSLGHRIGRTVGFGPPGGTDGIILGCPKYPWDKGWEGRWDLDHLMGQMRILGCPNYPWDTGWEGQWDLDHLVGQMGQSWDVPSIHGTQDGKDSRMGL